MDSNSLFYSLCSFLRFVCLSVEYRAVRQRKYVRIGRGHIDRHARHAINNVLALQLLRCAEQSVVYTDPVAFNIAPIINGSLYKDAVHGVKQAVIRRRDPLLFEMQNILIRRDPLLFIGGEGRRTLIPKLAAAVPDPDLFSV